MQVATERSYSLSAAELNKQGLRFESKSDEDNSMLPKTTEEANSLESCFYQRSDTPDSDLWKFSENGLLTPFTNGNYMDENFDLDELIFGPDIIAEVRRENLQSAASTTTGHHQDSADDLPAILEDCGGSSSAHSHQQTFDSSSSGVSIKPEASADDSANTSTSVDLHIMSSVGVVDLVGAQENGERATCNYTVFDPAPEEADDGLTPKRERGNSISNDDSGVEESGCGLLDQNLSNHHYLPQDSPTSAAEASGLLIPVRRQSIPSAAPEQLDQLSSGSSSSSSSSAEVSSTDSAFEDTSSNDISLSKSVSRSFSAETEGSDSSSPPPLNDVDEGKSTETKNGSKKTAYNEKWGVKVLKAWCNDTNKPDDFETLSAMALNDLLSSFWADVRKSNGDYYGRNSLYNLRAMINKHLKGKPYFVDFDIVTDERFRSSNDTLENQLRILKGIGRTITHKQPISMEDLRKMYDSGCLGATNPLALLRKVWFEITLHFCQKRSEAQEKLRKDSFKIYCDQNTMRRYVARNKEKYNSTDETRMYETGGDLCPVRSLELYLEKLHALQDRLFQQPRRKATSKSAMWYGKAPIGEKALQQMMANISISSGLSKRYTNHCVRATALEQFHTRKKKPGSNGGGGGNQQIKDYYSNLQQSRNNSQQVASGNKRRFLDILSSDQIPGDPGAPLLNSTTQPGPSSGHLHNQSSFDISTMAATGHSDPTAYSGARSEFPSSYGHMLSYQQQQQNNIYAMKPSTDPSHHPPRYYDRHRYAHEHPQQRNVVDDYSQQPAAKRMRISTGANGSESHPVYHSMDSHQSMHNPYLKHSLPLSGGYAGDALQNGVMHPGAPQQHHAPFVNRTKIEQFHSSSGSSAQPPPHYFQVPSCHQQQHSTDQHHHPSSQMRHREYFRALEKRRQTLI